MQPTIERYGSGHINETYRMACPDGPQYIFQKINTSIFPDPNALMENIRRVTEHIRSKHPDDPRCTLTVLDYSRPWRQYVFIEGARTYDLIERPEQAYKVARAFARFQNDLADLPGPRLHEILPHFHDTRARLAQLDAALAADVKGRAKEVAAELAFVDARRDEAGRILDLMASGDIPERITHNDTKINNVMLDDATGEGVAVIDRRCSRAASTSSSSCADTSPRRSSSTRRSWTTLRSPGGLSRSRSASASSRTIWPATCISTPPAQTTISCVAALSSRWSSRWRRRLRITRGLSVRWRPPGRARFTFLVALSA